MQGIQLPQGRIITTRKVYVLKPDGTQTSQYKALKLRYKASELQHLLPLHHDHVIRLLIDWLKNTRIVWRFADRDAHSIFPTRKTWLIAGLAYDQHAQTELVVSIRHRWSNSIWTVTVDELEAGPGYGPNIVVYAPGAHQR